MRLEKLKELISKYNALGLSYGEFIKLLQTKKEI